MLSKLDQIGMFNQLKLETKAKAFQVDQWKTDYYHVFKFLVKLKRKEH